ncbi:C-type lectin domain family 4 member A-like isoform 2-T2 [Rhynchonycteris naso]
MTSEITYAEVRFTNEFKSSSSESDPPAVFFQKYSQLLKEKKTIKEFTHTTLECKKENLTIQEKNWNCCPKNWMSFSLNCYFISTETKNWSESKQNCSGMGAHLLVINTKEEQDFIIQNLKRNSAYYVGLSDPEGKGDWQWVDHTSYNESATFWHQGEPNDPAEHCVILHAHTKWGSWGWNDVPCSNHHIPICKMIKIYL